ncbi:MAG: endonuclease/exonuclease/phosphatase family protein [Pseudomonadota bacterium]
MATRLRLATWNIEWFDALFDNDGRLLDDAASGRRQGVSRADQAAAIAHVMAAVDADLMLIVEAPDVSRSRSGIAALEGFAAQHGLRQRRVVAGFPSGTQQELALLFDPDILTARHDPQGRDAGPGAPAFNTQFRWDIDADGRAETHVFSKPPLEAAIGLRAGGPVLRLIGVHAKSKAPHGARTADDAMRIAIANRRKQLAQCHWIRLRVEAHLDAGDPVVVLGDLNDGPGLDAYEALFGRSGVEIVLGVPDLPARQLVDPHAQAVMAPRRGPLPSTARFFLAHEDRFLNALLDYVMLSADLVAAGRPIWRIWHPFDDPACFSDETLRTALLTASDHFPVSAELTV